MNNEAQEVKARAKELRERKSELKSRLESSSGKESRSIRLELARVEEELIDCSRRLKELVPNHKISYTTTWAGTDGWKWDQLQYRSWAELEMAEEGVTKYDMMKISTRAARKNAPTEIQDKYLTEKDSGKRVSVIARELGKDRSVISRTIRRGNARISKEAKALYKVLESQAEFGKELVIDLSNEQVLDAVLSLLTPTQQLYLYLYYGEWMSLREIGRLVRVDHASVLRSIRCGLERLKIMSIGNQVKVIGIDFIEDRLIEYFNMLEMKDISIPPRTKSNSTNHAERKPFRIVNLKDYVIELVRGDETRLAKFEANDMIRTNASHWGSGKLISAIENWIEKYETHSKEKDSRRQMLGRLLIKLFKFIRRTLNANDYSN